MIDVYSDLFVDSCYFVSRFGIADGRDDEKIISKGITAENCFERAFRLVFSLVFGGICRRNLDEDSVESDYI